MKMRLLLRKVIIFLGSVALVWGCKQSKETEKKEMDGHSAVVRDMTVLRDMPEGLTVPSGMVWIPGNLFEQGAVIQDTTAMMHEKPAFTVAVDGFFMDITEVTNQQFRKFVEQTGYVTVAEREVDWEDLKSQLPEGTPKPHDSVLQPGSLTFQKSKVTVPNLHDFSQWWKWTIGANWKHPNGPGSSIEGKPNDPVVQIAYEDAVAYCEWAGRRLPTEAEWELAARGNQKNSVYIWGDDPTLLSAWANTWEGEFPVENTVADGFERRAPVKSYPPNDFGLYDMAGNVWEWTSDWYNTQYYGEMSLANGIKNPMGPASAFNDRDPYAKEKVIKGGSFLCAASYCANYRVSARMASSTDSSLEHLGFRAVATVDMIEKENKGR